MLTFQTRSPSFFFPIVGVSRVGRALSLRLPPHRQVACQRKLWGECARLGAHYALLFALFPARVLLPAVFLSGLLTATIVTVSHVTEDLYFDGPHKVGVWGVGLVCLGGRWQARQTLRPPFLLLPLRVGQWLHRHRHTHTRTRQSRALSVSLLYFGPQFSQPALILFY